MKKIKVLLIREDLKNYRDPIYKLINEHVNLTVAYTIKDEVKKSTYNIIKFPSYKIGKAYFHRNVYQILNQYDVVIFVPHLKFLGLNRILFLPHKFKLITWTIGVYVSYNRPYDLTQKPTLLDKLYEMLQDRADACIFYMPEPIEYWKKYNNINTDKYFVAHNTVEVADFGKLPDYETRDSFLFVGSLYRQKGLGELIDAYKIAKDKYFDLPKLKIVGKGAEKENIQKQIQDYGLEDEIVLCGPIYDENILKEFYFKALLCISPKQAGLTVLKSLGYGTPFVTHGNAITGGERTNIKNGYNGLFYESVDELAHILIDSTTNHDKYKIMSECARNYYLKNSTPFMMAQGVLDAIDYVLNNSD